MEKLLKTAEAAKILDVKTNTLEVWRSQNRGPRFVKACGAVRYRLEDLENFINSCTVETAAAEVA